jgi:hypothetical protein
MMNSGPEMFFWSVVVVGCWIHGRDLGQKQKTIEFFRLLSHNPFCQWPNNDDLLWGFISPYGYICNKITKFN